MPTTRLLVLVLLIVAAGLSGCSKQPDPSLNVGGIDMGEVLQGLLIHTRQTMSKVDSLPAAKKARVQLQRINEDYDDLLFHLPKLSDEGRAKLAKDASRALPEMKALADRIHEMPALDDILGGELDRMVERLALVR